MHQLFDKQLPDSWAQMLDSSLGGISKELGSWSKQGYQLPFIEDYIWYNLNTFKWKLIP